MEGNRVTKSNNWKRYLAIGGFGIVVFGISYYLLRGSKKRLPKETVIRLLKETRKEMYPRLKDLTFYPQERKKLPQNELQKHINENIKAIQLKLAAKYGIDYAEIEDSVSFYKDDEDVKQLKALLTKDLTDAYERKYVTPGVWIPEFLTPRKVLEILAKIHKATLKYLNQLFRNYAQRGQPFPSRDSPDSRFIMDNDQKMKDEILAEEGLANFEVHPMMIMDHRLSDLRHDVVFQKYKTELNSQFDELCGKLMQGQRDLDEMIETVGEKIGDKYENDRRSY